MDITQPASGPHPLEKMPVELVLNSDEESEAGDAPPRVDGVDSAGLEDDDEDSNEDSEDDWDIDSLIEDAIEELSDEQLVGRKHMGLFETSNNINKAHSA